MYFKNQAVFQKYFYLLLKLKIFQNFQLDSVEGESIDSKETVASLKAELSAREVRLSQFLVVTFMFKYANIAFIFY